MNKPDGVLQNRPFDWGEANALAREMVAGGLGADAIEAMTIEAAAVLIYAWAAGAFRVAPADTRERRIFYFHARATEALARLAIEAGRLPEADLLAWEQQAPLAHGD